MQGTALPEGWQNLWSSVWTLTQKEEVIRRLQGRMINTLDDEFIIAKMKEQLIDETNAARNYYQEICPLGFFKPSFDQAQILNAWHPEFEPELAPNGYRSILIFDGNQIGKSSAVCVDTLLWMCPNDKDWVMFEEHEDPFGRGKYTVFPRPDFETWKKRGEFVYPWRNASPKSGRQCFIWHGVQDRKAWDETIGPAYRKWIPAYEIGKRGQKQEEDWSKTDMAFSTRSGHKLTAKLYGSETQAWAGKSCWRLNLDEGIDRPTLGEALVRIQSGGQLYWAYTPVEGKNLGGRAQLAYECYEGKYKLVGATKVFVGRGLDTCPDYIMPVEKKEDEKRRWSTQGAEGEARRRGGFFNSSPVVFNHFKPDIHVLPMDGHEAIAKWGKNANLFRGIDEGIAHPGTCIWGMLLPSGEFVIYRNYSQINKSIGDRVKDIVELSHNTLSVVSSTGIGDSKIVRYSEVFSNADPDKTPEHFRATFADWHLWNRKNESLNDTRANDYFRAGLKVRKGTGLGPQARCDNVNDMFRLDHTRLHLFTKQAPGTRLYVTRDCEILIDRLKNYLQAQYKTGDKLGQFKGTPEELGDDEIDAMCYMLLGNLRWIPPAMYMHSPDSDLMDTTDTAYNPRTGYVPISR